MSTTSPQDEKEPWCNVCNDIQFPFCARGDCPLPDGRTVGQLIEEMAEPPASPAESKEDCISGNWNVCHLDRIGKKRCAQDCDIHDDVRSVNGDVTMAQAAYNAKSAPTPGDAVALLREAAKLAMKCTGEEWRDGTLGRRILGLAKTLSSTQPAGAQSPDKTRMEWIAEQMAENGMVTQAREVLAMEVHLAEVKTAMTTLIANQEEVERELSAAHAALAEAQRDAARYRYLREGAYVEQVEYNSWYLAFSEVEVRPSDADGVVTPELVDQRVDSALSSTGEGSGG